MGRTLIASHSMELPAGAAAPEWVQLLPYGTFEGRDGRGPYVLRDVAHAAAVIAATAAYQRGADVPIDYDHQLLFTQQNGQPAVASGWVKEMQARPDGLWGRVEWTAQASARVTGREYRYLSPVFRHRPDGTVTRMVAAALTNMPNLELTALASSSLLIDDEDYMDELKKLALALGLPETATAEQIAAHCQGLTTTIKAVAEANKKLAAAVGKKETDAPADVMAAASASIVALATMLKAEAPTTEKIAAAAQKVAAGAGAGDPDPSKFVPMAAFQELQTQVAAMSSSIAGDKAAAAVAQAKAEGKVSPAMEGWATGYAAKDLDGFTAWCSAAPQIVTPAKGGGATAKPPAATDKHGLTDDEIAVCSQLGLSPEEFAKNKPEEIA